MLNLKKVLSFKSYKSSTNKLEDQNVQVRVDNRELCENSIFIAIVGARFNPLEHLDKIVDARCGYVVYEQSDTSEKLISNYKDQITFIKTTNIEKFIQEAAHEVSKDFQNRGGSLIAISGSNGKTTTKEMLYHLLASEFNDLGKLEKVICTQKNNNNHLGVPFTLFLISEKTQVAIIELGSNHPGEIQILCEIAKPQIAFCTNIGATHLEFFDGIEGVFKEEAYPYNDFSKAFYLNIDDKYLSRLEIKDKVKSISQSRGADFNLKLESDYILVNETKLKNSSITGEHNFINMASAYILALDVLNSKKRDSSKLFEFATTFKPTSNRSEWIEVEGKKHF